MKVRQPAIRIRLARLVLVLAAIFVGLLGAESAARALPDSTPENFSDDPDDNLWADPAWRSPPAHVYRPDADVGYVHAPSAVADVKVAEHPNRAFRFRTNGYGLRRDEEITIPKAPGTFRVLVLGDSQTSGYSNNHETYPGRLEAIWRARSDGRAIEVANAGVDGYGPQQAYLWYLEHGRKLGADLVIFAVYVGNDIDDLAHGAVDGATIDDDAGLVGPIRTPLTWLSLHSHLIQTVRFPLHQALDDILLPAPPVSEDALIRLLRECHGCWLQSLKQAVRARAEPEYIERAYRRIELIIRLLEAITTPDGGRLAILLIPTKIQVEPDDERGAVGRATRLLDLAPTDPEYDSVVYGRVREAAERAGVAVIDPLPDLRALASQGRLYYRRDWHLNPDGNLALAQAINRSLSSAELGP